MASNHIIKLTNIGTVGPGLSELLCATSNIEGVQISEFTRISK